MQQKSPTLCRIPALGYIENGHRIHLFGRKMPMLAGYAITPLLTQFLLLYKVYSKLVN